MTHSSYRKYIPFIVLAISDILLLAVLYVLIGSFAYALILNVLISFFVMRLLATITANNADFFGIKVTTEQNHSSKRAQIRNINSKEALLAFSSYHRKLAVYGGIFGLISLTIGLAIFVLSVLAPDVLNTILDPLFSLIDTSAIDAVAANKEAAEINDTELDAAFKNALSPIIYTGLATLGIAYIISATMAMKKLFKNSKVYRMFYLV